MAILEESLNEEPALDKVFAKDVEFFLILEKKHIWKMVEVQ